MDSNLRKRIVFAAVAIPLALGVVWWGGWALAALVALISGLGSCEFYDLAVRTGVRPLRWTGCIFAVLTPLVFQWQLVSQAGKVYGPGFGIIVLGSITLVTLLIITLTLFRCDIGDKPLSSAAVTLFGIVYTAVLPSSILIIRADQPVRSWVGATLVFFPLVITWLSDTAAMFAGRAFGRAKLAPSISPGKTRVGAVAGVIAGIGIGVVFAVWVFPRMNFNGCGGTGIGLVLASCMGLILSVVGQVGDLAESLMKREAGVKDSSALIPGHGGVLDRFDSLYFVIPFATLLYFMTIFGIAC